MGEELGARRAVGVIAAVALLAVVAVLALHDWSGSDPDRKQTSSVRILIGSEKFDFFNDQEVQAELAAQGLKTDLTTTGSWSMASTDLRGFDLAFPASQPPAERIRADHKITSDTVRPFYSPLVVIAHGYVADLLKEKGLATRADGSGVWTLRMDQYLKGVEAGATWQSLKPGSGPPELTGPLFISTTDPESSSSGALYLAELAYLKNGGQVVADAQGVKKVQGLLYQLTSMQGDQKTSSDGPFKDFLSGVGNPLVLVYESQVAALIAQHKPADGLVVLYPDTTVYSDHTAVGLTPNGDKLAQLLRDDPKLRQLEARYGFRPQADSAAFTAAVSKDATNPVLAPDLSAAGVAQAKVPTLDILTQLVSVAKGK
ncbi:hypothetical protein CFP65_1735 [Kitasatospora sp. MMS16-BH015]|uniref:substrate-binding domain-containing protein n=1 Tax=Kitasatospora sp. MMS16-BH015 TaxID=2018025 RepID=UPI000CA27224|nr:substrate-binding domain-containing protein [Kitasatospora sp. MMS16-BH015]AUG76614.1 hypothetical protein CFP65_1735 [Kitasatospora sp. MMS16-BH015]